MKNKNVEILDVQVLSDNWYTLRKFSFKYQNKSGVWETQHREAYDRGNGATILLYNTLHQTIILTQQFRLPTYINGNDSGLLIEACAGLLDDESPEDCIRRETEEETGFRISSIEKVFEAYMSPGSVTEILHFFIAEYEPNMKINDGGGLNEEQENIEVLELKIDKAAQMIKTGEIKDGKTIMLIQHLLLNKP